VQRVAVVIQPEGNELRKPQHRDAGKRGKKGFPKRGGNKATLDDARITKRYNKQLVTASYRVHTAHSIRVFIIKISYDIIV